MSLASKNLIIAAVAITKMNGDDKEILLHDLLENHPTAVMEAMKRSNVKFADAPSTLWNVVVDDKGINKINVIKMFREENGAGLADAKFWTEGKDYGNLKSGVIYKELTATHAKEKADRIMTRNPHGGFTVKLIRADAPYSFNHWEFQG